MAKFILIGLEDDEEAQEFETAEEIQDYLKENFEGDVDALRVFEVETEYAVKKSFDLEEID